MIYENILSVISKGEKLLSFLIDPDKCSDATMEQLVAGMKKRTPHFLLVGGSLISTPVEPLLGFLKKNLDIPIVLYPGHSSHVVQGFDAMLFLSMISGRNPELLIGNHVIAAPTIRRYSIEPISTGYMLIDGGHLTSVEYISNTRPIPADKPDIAVATAIAGEMIGMKLIYMDAGSGAYSPVPACIISRVKANTSIPLMIGGGIDTPEKLATAYQHGADIVVIGNALEKNPELLNSFMDAAKL
ncbi:MAG: geranylgeranylglyceryl/heptaprenylglyceryl phosphate synthase [Cytophagaceae bacterium]|jgi:putative glycerol-1-phosphate prenyltransferase|nr:geranylgeranylglyceryl/heptaprenylglyceryl phosphate synthase [Cytophagaceae bacterium]